MKRHRPFRTVCSGSGVASRFANCFGRRLAILTAAVFSLLSPAFAVDVNFDNGAADNDWNNTINWDTAGVDGLPTVADVAHINLGFAGLPGSGANISAALTNPQVGSFLVGDAGTGVVTQTAGALSTVGDSSIGMGATNVGQYYNSGGTLTIGQWMFVGVDGGTGRYEQSGTGSTIVNSQLHIGDGLAGTGTFTHHTGSVTVLSQVIVGGGAGSDGTYHMGAGNLSVQGDFNVGIFGGTGVFNQNGGDVSTAAQFQIGAEGGIGTYNLAGGTLSVAGSHYVGRSGGVGTMVQSAGTTFNVGSLIVGRSEFGNGTYTNQGGTINATAQMNVGIAGGNGVFNQYGGDITLGSDVTVGTSEGSFGTLNFNVGNITSNAGEMQVGFNGGTGTVNMGGRAGNLTVGNINVGGHGGGGTFIQDGGNVTSGSLVVGTDNGVGTYIFNAGDVTSNSVTVGVIGGTGTFKIGAAGTFDASGMFSVGVGLGNGVFTQYGGNGSSAALEIGTEGGDGTYNMGAGPGTFTVHGNVHVGQNGGTGRVNQTGGTIAVGDLGGGTGDLIVGPGGIYNMANGLLKVGNNLIAGAGSPRFNFTGGIVIVGGIADFQQNGLTTVLDVTGPLPGGDTEIAVSYDLGAGTALINGGNTLKVTGVINNLPGTGSIYVGTSGAGTLMVTGAADVDTLILHNGTVTTAGLTVRDYAIAVGGNAAATINGPVTLRSGGTIEAAAGTLTLTGNLSMSNGDIGGAGTLNATGGFSAAGGSVHKFGSGTTNIAGPQSHGPGAALFTLAGTTNLNSDANGNLSVFAIAATNFGSTTHLGNLTVSGGATAQITAGGAKLLVTKSIGPIAGKLDLTDNDLIVQAAPGTAAAVLATVTGLLATGSNGLAWTGNGINSSAAAADATFLTALGVMLNDDGFGGPYHATFSGEPVDANSVLVKYTYYGDADLSGSVDGTDYALTDNGFNSGLSGWFHGDFDYSGAIDGTDYALIDNAFNGQTGPLVAGPTGPAVPEPSAWALGVLGSLGIAAFRRRRSPVRP